MGIKPVSLELHIEELVLHGFAPGDRYRIGDAMKREIAHLFAKRGTPPLLAQGSEIGRLVDGTFGVRPGSGAEAIGVRVARAVYGGLRA